MEIKGSRSAAAVKATPQIRLRTPATTTRTLSTPSTFTPPPISWLCGTWHVTHSTLPMWSKSRNVRITYTAMPLSENASSPPRLNDLVEYQSLTCDKLKTVEGIDTPASNGAWNWRGKGWLMIATSHWEVLGYGGCNEHGGPSGEEWIITYFAKTLFTPAGLDIYSRKKEGLDKALLKAILEAVANIEDEGIQKLAKEIFVVKSDFY